jgi:hypothetical protein
MLLTRPSPQLPTLELRFQFRATVRPSRRDCCNSILIVSGFPVPARCPSLPGGSAIRWIQPMSLKLSALEADGSAIVSCGTRSCSRPSVPSVRRNWPSAKLLNKAPSFTTMASNHLPL